ncbi:MAG TPA: uridine kinase [Microscillaceae bacterium]|nr:uridine kinase [Microscillaceae bacterium]
MAANKPFIIGVTGGSGAGKTFILNRLLENFNAEEVCLVSQDHYYHNRDLQPKDVNGVSNFDTPESIDLDQYFNDIKQLSEGKTIFKKEYTYNNPNVTPKILEFTPTPIILVEGIFIFYHKPLNRLIDLKVFIDVEDHIRLKRRIIRDNEERGYGLEDVLYRYENHVIPTYKKYIAPYKYDADIILPNGDRVENALNVLITFLKSKIYHYE